MGTRVSLLPLLLLAAAWARSGSTLKVPSFPFGLKCAGDATQSRYLVAPVVTSPSAGRYCFTLHASACYARSTCCDAGVASFTLNALPACDGATITATLDGRALPGVATVSPPPGAAAIGKAGKSLRVLTVTGLALTSSAFPAGATHELCLTLPPAGKCTNLTHLIAPVPLTPLPAVNAATKATISPSWSAALISSDSKCCPVSRGSAWAVSAAGEVAVAPAGSCETCFVYDALGKDGTLEGTAWDYRGRTSCALSALPVEFGANYTTCCAWAGSSSSYFFNPYRAKGVVLSGFHVPICDKTSFRVCGVLSSPAAGKQMVEEWDEDTGINASLPANFDGTDDTCALALINSTIRYYTSPPQTTPGVFDGTCVPYKTSVEMCSTPDREQMYEFATRFPKETCDDAARSTPFAVEPLIEIVRSEDQTDFCFHIRAVKAENPNTSASKCGKVNSVSRVSFWLEDEPGRRPVILGAYLSTRAGKRSPLNATWGPPGDNTLNVFPVGLDAALARKKQPKICIERNYGDDLWYDSVDASTHIWVALYDASGECCPTYWTNRY